MNSAWVVMAAAASGSTALASGAALRMRNRRIRTRARRVGIDPARNRRRPVGRRQGREWLVQKAASVLLGAGLAALLGGTMGWLLGIVMAGLGLRFLPTPPGPAERARRRDSDLLRSQLPLTADLLAGCMASWCPPDAAVGAVAEAMPQPMAGRLVAAAVQLSMGADPEACWERLGEAEPVLAPLGRCLARAASSGAPPAAGLARLADAERASAAREAQARVRRAGVLATAPLGLCFLPAFVLVGVVPVVTGLAGIFLGRL
ncbi:type II secretion system F family protein [Streptacidiphilus anmyonensis]|uniref:type II secretion system F family protein n=1 Tax=Streptacidiphilus anmyonensis TaxID=405782 RepID=UPI000694B007|nr:type II secretion system F family protein [Streptacidiphilus anmyonensis]